MRGCQPSGMGNAEVGCSHLPQTDLGIMAQAGRRGAMIGVVAGARLGEDWSRSPLTAVLIGWPLGAQGLAHSGGSRLGRGKRTRKDNDQPKNGWFRRRREGLVFPFERCAAAARDRVRVIAAWCCCSCYGRVSEAHGCLSWHTQPNNKISFTTTSHHHCQTIRNIQG